MGLIGIGQTARGIGTAAAQIGGAVTGVAEVFHANRTAREAMQHAERSAALSQFAAEFAAPRRSAFDAVIDGINRVPRPAMAFATMGLFAFAMWQPAAFAARMEGLALVPEPLWWLMGAIVGFYFGARELHHRRLSPPAAQEVARAVAGGQALDPARHDPPDATGIRAENPVIADWNAHN